MYDINTFVGANSEHIDSILQALATGEAPFKTPQLHPRSETMHKLAALFAFLPACGGVASPQTAPSTYKIDGISVLSNGWPDEPTTRKMLEHWYQEWSRMQGVDEHEIHDITIQLRSIDWTYTGFYAHGYLPRTQSIFVHADLTPADTRFSLFHALTHHWLCATKKDGDQQHTERLTWLQVLKLAMMYQD